MKWVDRYLYEVASYLPKDSREDIKQELKSSLYEQLEDKSEQLGRTLEEEEEKAVLKQLGHPMKVAAEYAPQQYLIGPALFPQFKYMLKLATSIVIAIQIALTMVVLFTNPEWFGEFPGLISRLLWGLVLTIVCVVGAFTIMEYSGEKLDWYKNWDPSNLPTFMRYERVDRTDNIFNVVFEAIGLLWWNGAISFTNGEINGVSAWNFGLSAGWTDFYWPVNIVLLGSLMLHCYQLFFEHWNLPQISTEIVLNLASLAILYFLFQLDPLVVYHGDIANASEKALRMREILDNVLWYILLFIMLISVYELYKHGKIFYRYCVKARAFG